MVGFSRRRTVALFAAVAMAAAIGPTAAASLTSGVSPVGFLPFPSGSSIYVSQGNCVNGSTGIPNPTHCDQFGRYAWDFVYARNGLPAQSQGLPVVAAASGTVMYAFDAGRGDPPADGCQNSGSGNFVIVDDGDGTYTQYIHLEDGTVPVHEGDPIVTGEAIGSIGSSGEAYGAHLHFSWVTDVDYCGVGTSTPGSFDQSPAIPSFGDVLTSNNPGPLAGELVTDGVDTYVVAGGAPILLPDCEALYDATACSGALALPDLDGFAAHPVNGTDLVAEPSHLAYRVVGGAPVPIPDCASFSTCAADFVTVPDSAISTPDARLSGSPTQWSFMRAGGGNPVWQFDGGCVRSSSIWFDATFATLIPPSALTLWPGCPLPEPNVSIKKGSANGSNIFFSLWDQDGDAYGLTSSQSSPQAAMTVTFSGVPKAATSLTANVATKASRSCTQKVSVWNWKSSSWDTFDSATVSSTYVVRTDLDGKGSPGAYVKGSPGDVRLQLSCQRGKGRFNYSVDWTQVRYGS
ncbi:MAG: hypothetical protein QOE83_2091 [Actinomycetota bacterium]|jgi:hypothetical protein|nr:hypothetical protein [Actinomycetota bacterium]